MAAVWTTLVLGLIRCLLVSPASPQVRLRGSNFTGIGRVEIYHNGTWGTVCDDDWGQPEGHVVCRMLGYNYVIQVSCCAKYGRGTGPIWLDNLKCNGSQSNLASCSTEGWGIHDCSHGEDASVVCSNSPVAVHLREGSTPAEGRVEVNLNGVWGTVCDRRWDIRDGHVVCRMLGYKRALQASCCSKYGQGSGQAWINDVQCNGKEKSLGDCSSMRWGLSKCHHNQEAGVICSNDSISVRLKNGSSLADGRVEVYHKRTWGTVCDDSWNLRDGHVICHMLGYSHALQTSCCARYGQGKGPILLDDLECTGKESSLFSCRHQKGAVVGCSHSEDAGVVCSVNARLVGNSDADGQVEIYYNGAWGRVCGSSWDMQDGRVVCHMLGYLQVLAVGSKTLWKGDGSIWMSSVQCTGTERSIATCRHKGWGVHDCNRDHNAWVFCDNCTVRLVNGRSNAEGRVEVHHNGVWGTVCANNWDVNDGHVVCRMLGYSYALQATCCANYGQGTGPILLDNVRCKGSESSLLSCSHNGVGVHRCKHNQDASVMCAVSVRLVGGKTSAEGRVEVYYNRAWGTVVRDHNTNNARVVCHMLGFTHNLGTFLYAKNMAYGEGAGHIWLHGIRCTGSEKSLVGCPGARFEQSYLTHNNDAGLICSNKTVRLLGGSSSLEGRVEVYREGAWGRVCDTNWTLTDAYVVCKTLGYSGALYASADNRYGQGNRHVWLNSVQCNGSEKTLIECPHKTQAHGDCPTGKEVGVICSVPVRLLGGGSPAEGSVELFYNGAWGTVCNDGWDLRDGHVICRMLGYSHALQATSGRKYGQSKGHIWLSSVMCSGIESDILACPHDGWGTSRCNHNEGVGVVCYKTNLTGPTEKMADIPTQQELVSYVAAVSFLSLLVCILLAVGAFFIYRQTLHNKPCTKYTSSKYSGSTENGNEERSRAGLGDYEEVICRSTNSSTTGNTNRNNTSVNNYNVNNAVILRNDNGADFSVDESSSGTMVGNRFIAPLSQPRVIVEDVKRPTPSTKRTRVKPKLDRNTKKDSVNRQPCDPFEFGETYGRSENYMALSPTRREGIETSGDTQKTDINLYQSLVKRGDLNHDNVKEQVYNNVDTKAV